MNQYLKGTAISSNIDNTQVLAINKISAYIKHIDLSRSLVKSNYLDYLILGMGIFDNYSVNILNLAYNYLNENFAKNLGRIIHKFK